MTSDLKIVEFFTSIQGESSFSGLPCHFVRLAGCNLSCNFCDTMYANNLSESEINILKITTLTEYVMGSRVKLVEFTGGEPLLQLDRVVRACRELVNFATVLIETNGSVSIKEFKTAPKNLVIIMDCKTPSSGMQDKMFWANFMHLRPTDEIKFVVGNHEDFLYAKSIVEDFELEERKVIVSPIYQQINLEELADWILTSAPFFRLQVQLHKIIWGPTKRGV